MSVVYSFKSFKSNIQNCIVQFSGVLRSPHSDFHSSCYGCLSLQSHQQCFKVSLSAHSGQCLWVFVSLTTAILTGVMVHEAHMFTDSARETRLVKHMDFFLQQKKLFIWKAGVDVV